MNLKNNKKIQKKKIMKKRINSLYIHIPFCRSLCPYCDFAKLLKNNKFEDGYISQLLKDLSSLKDKFFKFKTIFIGGGTPSCLNNKNLSLVLEALSKLLRSGGEFTIEANPEDIDVLFLNTIKKYGVNRISIGVQTFDQKILDSIHRNYHLDIFSLIKNVKKYVNNINLDFIYGLPGYSKQILENDLETFFKLDVNHASFYSLIVSQGTMYFNSGIKEIDEDISCDYYLYILKEMRKHGFERYEVSNYSKPGYECKHNLTYWHNEEYVGVGLNSSGYVSGVRYTNTKNFSDYINGINNIEKEIITYKSLKEYYFITNLRLSKGFSINDYNKIFHEDFLTTYKSKIKQMIKAGQVMVKNGRFFCTDKGLLVLDLVILDLI